MQPLRFEADIGLLEVLPGIRIAVARVNDVEHLTEADIQVKADGSGGVVDAELHHVDVRRVGADVEGAQSVETVIGIVEVGVHIPVEQEAEIGAPLMQGTGIDRGRRGRWRGSCRGGCRSGRCLCLEPNRQAQEHAEE